MIQKDTHKNLNALNRQLHQEWYMEEWDTQEKLTIGGTVVIRHLVWIITMIGLFSLFIAL